MRQSDFYRAVANVTGETISTVRSLGFVPLLAIPYECEPDDEESDDREGLAIDWDASPRFDDVARPIDELIAV